MCGRGPIRVKHLRVDSEEWRWKARIGVSARLLVGLGRDLLRVCGRVMGLCLLLDRRARLRSELSEDVGLRSRRGWSLVKLLLGLGHERGLLELKWLSHRAHGLRELSDRLRVLSSVLGLHGSTVVESEGVRSGEERWSLRQESRESLVEPSALVLIERPVDLSRLLRSVRVMS